MHDLLTPALTRLISPTFPLHNTLIAANVLLLVGITLGGRWVPVWCWLLPVGWGPLVVGALSVSSLLLDFPPYFSSKSNQDNGS